MFIILRPRYYGKALAGAPKTCNPLYKYQVAAIFGGGDSGRSMDARDDQIAALRAVIAENEAAMAHMRKLVETLRGRLAQQHMPAPTVDLASRTAGKSHQQQQHP